MNRDLAMTLEEAVTEVLGTLTGLDLEYDPQLDRFRSITRALNRGLRAVALEHEWSFYSDVEELGVAQVGVRDFDISSSMRPRIINDDCIRLIDSEGRAKMWCYFLPRDAIHKYEDRAGLWAAVTRSTITFSRPFQPREKGWRIMVPVMREPQMFRLPKAGTVVPPRILNQLVDFSYPDLVVAKAAQYVAEADPVMQPRVQTLEAQYKDLMYQLIERDDRMTDSPYLNDFTVPIRNSIYGGTEMTLHPHPHSDERWR